MTSPLDQTTYNFDRLPDRRSTESTKWRHYLEDVIPMWIADMDFPSPEPVLQALRDRVDHGIFGYPTTTSGEAKYLPSLVESLLAYLEEHYAWKVTPDEIILVPGVVTGLNLACHALAAPEGGVLVQPPIYPPFLSAPGNAGQAIQFADLSHYPAGDYWVDPNAFAAAITPQTRLFILCNPHNPSGRVFRKEELERMAEACLRRGVTICSDEIHCDLVYSGHRHIPLATLDPEIARSTITFMAPSKTYNLAGLDFSFAVIPNPGLRQRFLAARQGLVGWVNVLGLVAAEAAYRQGQGWLAQVVPYLETNRDYLAEFVTRELPGISMVKPEGTYLAWLDCREAGLVESQVFPVGAKKETQSGQETSAYHFFLKHARVALNRGCTFGPGGESFARLNFACPRPLLIEALQRMKSALEQRSASGQLVFPEKLELP